MTLLSAIAGLPRTPAGRFSWLKSAALVAAMLPAAWIAARWGAGLMGSRALNAVIHETGTWAIRFLLLSLAATPARLVLDWPRIVLLRRLLGVTACLYAGAHFLLFVADKEGDLLAVVSEIALRFYLTIGFVALLGLLALGITSTNGWQRALGRDWKRLHRLTFPITCLALFHHFLQAKADVGDAVLATGLFLWLALWRLEPRTWRGWSVALAGLAVSAAALTAVVEVLWYTVVHGTDPARVLAANVSLAHGPRPAVGVFLAGLVVLALSALRPLWASRRGGATLNPALSPPP